MISKEPSLAENINEEIPALIETLLATEQRLEDLTDGQVDSVAGRDGRTFVLRRAQDQLRHNEAVKQSAILNALSAHIALLDGQGFIISVNEAWRCFADANAMDAPGHGVGLNYLAICDQAVGDYSSEAHQVAAGVRAVLDGAAKSFSIEYPCHSPAEPGWFLMTVSPVAQDHPNGAVVMHLNITERKAGEMALQESEREQRALAAQLATKRERLRAALAASRTGTFRWEFHTNELNWDESLDTLFGIPPEQAVRSLETFITTLHPDDRLEVIELCARCARDGADFDMEFRVLWPDGSLHWLNDKGKTFFDAAGVPLYMTGACVDITERKLAEMALRESEAEFRALAEAMPQMVWITRADGWCVYFSQQWVDYTGLTIEQSLGHGWIKPFHPDDQERSWEAWQQATSTTGVYSIESRLRRVDGVYRWWLIRGVPQMDAAGKILKWFGTCTDIHDLKLAELEVSRANQALTESDEKFRQLAGNIADVFYMTSPDMQEMHYVSPAYELIWGRSVADLYARPQEWAEAIVPEDRERVWTTFSTVAAGAPSVSAEFRIARPDGSLRWILSRGFQVRNAEGELVRLTGIATDITEHKYAEDNLRETEERFSGAFEHAPIGMALASPAGRFLRVNQALCELVGYSEAELLARTFQDITHPRDIALSEENVRRVRTGADRSHQIEKLYVHKLGHPITVLVSISLVKDSLGRPSYFIGQIQDVSKRKELEAQLRQAHKLEAIGTLAGGIAHDFNNILAAIMGYTELAQKRLSPDGRPHANLAQVLKATGRARDLVQQILTFSRREEHEQRPLRVQDIIEETLDLIRASLPATIEIRRTIDQAVPRILGDATQIQQVIMNLCLNAGHAMKQGNGILGISLTSPDIDQHFREAHPEFREGPHILLSISDTGCGIDRAAQTRIFDPFYTTKAPGEGTGLGLAVVHGVVKNHDGVITVQSEVGVGTTFSIYLPACERPVVAVVEDALNIPRGNGEHILFVDDEEALASMGKLMLEEIGYRVTAKTDSVESLEAFRLQPEEFDLVVTDQTMPHLNGADLATALLKIRPALPVILLTGYSSAISPELTKAIGIRELLLKPCMVHVLAEAIQRALGSRQ